MGIRIKLNKSITDSASLTVLPKGTEYDLDSAPKVIQELFSGGDPRVEKVKVLVEKKEVEPKTKKAKEAKKAVEEATNINVLESVKGVGPTVAKKLNAAGVFNIDQLKALDKDKLANIVGTLAVGNIKV